jgi:predicted small lipoprotein YifL
MIRLTTLFLAAFLMTVSLSACGKKGDPKPPDKNSTYPQQYPKTR